MNLFLLLGFQFFLLALRFMGFLALCLGQDFRLQRVLEVIKFFIEVANSQFSVLARLVTAAGSGSGDAADHKQDCYHQSNDLGQKHAIFG